MSDPILRRVYDVWSVFPPYRAQRAIQFSICLYNSKRRKQEVGWPLPSQGRLGKVEHLDALHLSVGWAVRRANGPGRAERWQVRPGEHWQAGLDSVLVGRAEHWHPLRHMPGRAKPGCVALRLHQPTKQKLWQIESGLYQPGILHRHGGSRKENREQASKLQTPFHIFYVTCDYCNRF
jgi:hypothetical protein